MFVVSDRIKDTSTNTGLGSIVVTGTPSQGHRTFADVCSVNDQFIYSIQNQTSSEFEVGIGSYIAPHQFSRTRILSSSNNNLIVNFGAGTKDVFLTMAANNMIYKDANGKVAIGGSNVPESMLHITGETGTSLSAITIANNVLNVKNSAARIWMSGGNDPTLRGGYIQIINSTGANNGHDMTFAVSAGGGAPLEKLRIMHNGRVSINATPIDAQLEVGGLISSNAQTGSGGYRFPDGTIQRTAFTYRGYYSNSSMALALAALNTSYPSPSSGDFALLKSAYEGPAIYVGASGSWVPARANRTNGALRQWTGLEAEFYAANVIQVQVGSWSQADPYLEFESNAATLIDVTAVGLNGLSANYSAQSHPISQGWYFVWTIGNHTNGVVKYLISQQYTLTPFAAEKNLIDSNYTYVRMLPVAVYYNGAGATSPQVSNSFRDYYLRGSYPHPDIYWTRFDETTNSFKILNAGSNTTNSYINCSSWIPETGRLIHLTLLAEWDGLANSNGHARIGTYIGAVQGYQIECGGNTSGYPIRSRREITLAVDSAEQINYYCSSANVKLTVFARGYSTEEPS